MGANPFFRGGRFGGQTPSLEEEGLGANPFFRGGRFGGQPPSSEEEGLGAVYSIVHSDRRNGRILVLINTHQLSPGM